MPRPSVLSAPSRLALLPLPVRRVGSTPRSFTRVPPTPCCCPLCASRQRCRGTQASRWIPEAGSVDHELGFAFVVQIRMCGGYAPSEDRHVIHRVPYAVGIPNHDHVCQRVQVGQFSGGGHKRFVQSDERMCWRWCAACMSGAIGITARSTFASGWGTHRFAKSPSSKRRCFADSGPPFLFLRVK